MRFLIGLFSVPLLIGCASESELRMGYDAQVKSADIQAVIMREQPPTFSIDCSGGCGSAKIDYLDPRDRHKLVIPKVTNTNDTIIGVAPAVTKSVGYVAGAVTAIRVADDLFSSAGGGDEIHSTNITNGDGNTNDMGTTVSRSNSNGNTTNNNDNNSVTDSHDAVSEPVVIENKNTDNTETIKVVQPVVVDTDGDVIQPGLIQ